MKVLNQQILAEQLLVETEDHRRMVIDASEVLSTLPAGATPKIEPAATEETGEAGSNDRERKKSRRPRRRRKPASSTDSNPGSKDRGAAKNDQGSNKTDSPEKNPQASTDGETTTKKPRRNRSNRNRRRRSKRKPKSDDQS
jgi:hypothetical protein